MGGVLIYLAGTFIASCITLFITFKIFGSYLSEERANSLIFWFGVGSTILYWIIELYMKYLERKIRLDFIPSRDSIFSPREQLDMILLYILPVTASILFIMIATPTLWFLAVVMAIVVRPTNIGEAIGNLFLFLIVAIVLGVSLRFTSGFTTKWLEGGSKPRGYFITPSNQVAQLLLSSSSSTYLIGVKNKVITIPPLISNF